MVQQAITITPEDSTARARPPAARALRDTALASASVPYEVSLPARPAPAAAAPARAVPDVRGLDLRDAVRALHGAGFRVQLARAPSGAGGVTSPSAGSTVRPGALVRLHAP